MNKKHYQFILISGSFAILTIGLFRFGSFAPKRADSTRSRPECSEKEGPRYDEEGFEIIGKEISCAALKYINDSYQTAIKSIFAVKCLNCHGEAKRLPLYALLPPVSYLVQNDLRQAKKHMNMTHDFPFVGHGSEADDLKAIKKVIEQNSMPPRRYKIMHWRSTLTDYERQAILTWVNQSLEILQLRKENEK